MAEEPQDQPGTESGGGEAAAPAADEYTLRVNGEELSVSRDEVIRLAQMGQDYTNKTQALSQEREQMSRQVEERAIEIYRQALQEQQSASQGTQEELDPSVIMAQKLQAVEGKLSQFEQAQSEREADKQLDEILSNLRSEHKGLSEMDEKIILLQFNDRVNDQTDINQLFNQLAVERAKEKESERQAVIEDYVKAKTRDPFASGETGKGGVPPEQLSKPPTSMKDARERAEARLRAAFDR